MALIYIVEDDRNIREIETIALSNSGHVIKSFETAKEFYQKLEVKLPDLVLLDIMLPDEDGLEILKKIRNRKHTQKLPVLMLTVKSTELDKVKGLDMGADDYLSKPFDMGELLARIRAMLRRKEDYTPSILECGNVILNMDSYELCCNSRSLLLPKIEYQLMELFMLNKGI